MKHFRKKKVSKATSYRMSRITGKNTNPERYVRSVLHKNGFRFSLHKKNLPGKPDIVLTKYKTVINVNVTKAAIIAAINIFINKAINKAVVNTKKVISSFLIFSSK